MNKYKTMRLKTKQIWFRQTSHEEVVSIAICIQVLKCWLSDATVCDFRRGRPSEKSLEYASSVTAAW